MGGEEGGGDDGGVIEQRRNPVCVFGQENRHSIVVFKNGQRRGCYVVGRVCQWRVGSTLFP